jgi:hypothetical protein
MPPSLPAHLLPGGGGGGWHGNLLAGGGGGGGGAEVCRSSDLSRVYDRCHNLSIVTRVHVPRQVAELERQLQELRLANTQLENGRATLPGAGTVLAGGGGAGMTAAEACRGTLGAPSRTLTNPLESGPQCRERPQWPQCP